MDLILETLSCISPSDILQHILDCSVQTKVLLIAGVLDLRASSSGSWTNVSSLADMSCPVGPVPTALLIGEYCKERSVDSLMKDCILGAVDRNLSSVAEKRNMIQYCNM